MSGPRQTLNQSSLMDTSVGRAAFSANTRLRPSLTVQHGQPTGRTLLQPEFMTCLRQYFGLREAWWKKGIGQR